ncbi:MAG TPA: hypothetical protein VHK69_15125 [Chitinophagaceae bacterium]|jgi:hypothetical protein|nr:hypothetical protein [Chitinophagaceae bacterium]
MKRLFFLLLLGASGALRAQSFPQSFTGNWSGQLHWYPAGAPEPKVVDMQLRVHPVADSPGRYSWQIIYGKEGKDNRPYVLQPVDPAKGHWMIDERNGILLDGYWLGGRFSGAFSVGPSVITDTYYLQGDSLIVEFYATGKTPVRTSGLGTEASPTVESFGLRSFQRAVLRRKE